MKELVQLIYLVNEFIHIQPSLICRHLWLGTHTCTNHIFQQFDLCMVCFSFSFFFWLFLIVTHVSSNRISLSIHFQSFQSGLQPPYLFQQFRIASFVCNSSSTMTSFSECHCSPLDRNTQGLLNFLYNFSLPTSWKTPKILFCNCSDTT